MVVPLVAGKPSEQFARTPYAAGFQRGAAELILMTVHIIWGDNAASRDPEMTGSPSGCVRGPIGPVTGTRTCWCWVILTMTAPMIRYGAFLSTGLWPPVELNGIPRTVFDDPTKPHFYDEVAWCPWP